MTCIDAHRHSRLIVWDDAGVGVTKKEVEDATHTGKERGKRTMKKKGTGQWTKHRGGDFLRDCQQSSLSLTDSSN